VGLLQAAEKEAIKRGDQFVASEMLLLALCRRQDRLWATPCAPTA
jgi:hypothetical protein